MVKVGGEKEASWDSERRNSIPWGFGSCFPRRRRSASVRHTVRDVKAAAVASGACHTKECLLLCAFSNYGLCENCKMEAVLFQTMVLFSMYGSNIIYVEANLKGLKSPMVMNKVVQRNRSERLTCFLLYISRCYVPCTQQVIAHTCGRHFAMCGEKFSSRENSVALLKVTSSFLDFFSKNYLYDTLTSFLPLSGPSVRFEC